MLLQSKPLIYRTLPSNQQTTPKWKADNLPHLVGPVRYKIGPGFGDLHPNAPVTNISELRRPRPYVHYRYDYLPIIAPEQTQVSAKSYTHSAERSFELPGGASGITRKRSHREHDEAIFTNGMTGSIVDEAALQSMKPDNNRRIADAAKARVRSAGKQVSNKFAKYFTYSSNEEYLQSRAKTYAQNQFHYELGQDSTLYQDRAEGIYYRPQGAQFYRLRNEIDRDRRGPGFITIQSEINDKVMFRTFVSSTSTYQQQTIHIPIGDYDFRSLVIYLQEAIAALHPDGKSFLGLQYHAQEDRISATTEVTVANYQEADQFVVTKETQALWLLFGFSALQTNEDSRLLPSNETIRASVQRATEPTIKVLALGSIAPSLNGGIKTCGPINFHRNSNAAFQTTEPLDASTNTFRKKYNTIQKAAPTYISSYGLATATSLVYRKNMSTVRTAKDITQPAKVCKVECLL